MTSDGERSLLLFSGGLDSTALAVMLRPKLLLYVDYGHRARLAERSAAAKIAALVDLPLRTINLGIQELGSGLLHGSASSDRAPSPEWWPYRNQFLATAGAAVAHEEDCDLVLLGSVASDGERHKDGTAEFYRLLDAIVAYQEGGIHVSAPGIDRSTEQLVEQSGATDEVLAWTFSCHRSNRPCGDCPGCWKRTKVLADLGVDGYSWGKGE